MERSKEDIIKDEIMAGAVQVLPSEGLFKMVRPNIFKKMSFESYEQEKKEKKEWESPEHAALAAEKMKAWNEMQEITNPQNQDKSMRIKDLMSF